MTERTLADVLAELADQQEQEYEEKLVRVGRISQELQDEFKRVRKEHEKEHEAIKAKIDAYIKKVQTTHSCEQFHNAMLDIWEKVYDELGLTEEERGEHYTIRSENRVVFRLVDEDDTIEPLN